MKATTVGLIVLILVIISLSSFGTTHAYFNSKQVTGTHLISTWQSYVWTQTSQSDFLAGVLYNVNTSSLPGSVVLDNRTIGQSIFATTGGSRNCLQYFIANNTWVAKALTPANVGAGGGVRYLGSGNISAIRGSNTNNFWIYNISSNIWEVKRIVPANVNTGGTLSDYIGDGNISALRGSSTTTFWIYNISSNLWSVKAPSPASVGAGGVLAYLGSGNVSALRGANTRTFWIYNISSNTWAAKANTPANVGAGGAIAYDGGNYLYAFRGSNTRNFWRYNISVNSWSVLASIPGNVGAGGSLVSDKGNFIYAFNGTTKPYFWRYDIFNNSWSDAAVANPLNNIVAGGSLTYVAGSSGYIPVGTFASPVYDTGTATVKWEALIWDSTPVTGTNISFDVRASDTQFTKTDASPAWQQSGWPSPVYSGLPMGRYLQWRATLLTTDAAKTPILHEVRIWYS